MDISEWTEVKKGSFSRSPTISISKGKKARSINLSPSFIKLNNLSTKKYVKILTKKEENKIKMAFIFLDDEQDNAYTVTKNESSGAGYISASGAFSQLNVDPEKLKEFRFKPIEENVNDQKIYIIEAEIN